MQEIAPVANAKFSTINSPIIMDTEQVVTLSGGLKGRQIVLDTFYVGLSDNNVKIKISDKTCKVLYDPQVKKPLISRLKNIFSLNGNK